ncbi:MAG: hypothetical protein ACSHXY_12740 [Alphaproteobacteria bacterium]
MELFCKMCVCIAAGAFLASCSTPLMLEPEPVQEPLQTAPSEEIAGLQGVFRYGGEYNLAEMTFAFVGSELVADLDDCSSETSRCLTSGFEALIAPRCHTLDQFPAYPHYDAAVLYYGHTVIEDYYGHTVPASVYAVRALQDGKAYYSLSYFNPQYGVIATAITETAPDALNINANGAFTDVFALFYSKSEYGAFACAK